MKRMSSQERRMQPRLARRRWRKALRRRQHTYSVDEKRLKAPDVLSFRRNYDATTRFFEELRELTCGSGRKLRAIYVDLTSVEDISVAAAIVLASEFHRWTIVRSAKLRVRDAHKWSDIVKNRLASLGVFELLGLHPPPGATETFEEIILSPLSSGVRQEGRKIFNLQGRLQSIVQNFTKNPGVYEALSEAVENAITHAYPEDFEPPYKTCGYRWWGASCIDIETLELRFFIFDQGAGIPFTLPRQSFFERIRDKAAEIAPGIVASDATLLRAAVEVGRTRTQQANRGLGLKKMVGVIEGLPGGYLRILSGKGELVCYADERIEARERVRSIGGTLIEWRMTADAIRGSDDDDGNE